MEQSKMEQSKIVTGRCVRLYMEHRGDDGDNKQNGVAGFGVIFYKVYFIRCILDEC